MKFRKLFAVCTSLIVFTPAIVRAQISVQNGNTVIETDGNGKILILNDQTRISTPGQNQRFYPPQPQLWLRSYDNRQYLYPGRSCSHSNTQTSTVQGSGRQVTQTSVSGCH
jgi:hypothetical protein